MEIGESASKKSQLEDEPVPEKIAFYCKECSMSELVHYYGKKPPFVKNVEFLEEVFIMRNPFKMPPSRHFNSSSFTEHFLVIGSKCNLCGLDFCKECSIYYSKTFCVRCAHKHVSQFPLEIQSKIRKEFLSINNS